MRKHYTEFVHYCITFYLTNQCLHSHSNADKKNWFAVDECMRTLSNTDYLLISEAFKGNDTLADNVYETAKNHGINQDGIWESIYKLEHAIAKKRGLI
jgi:hypothetical protein